MITNLIVQGKCMWILLGIVAFLILSFLAVRVEKCPKCGHRDNEVVRHAPAYWILVCRKCCHIIKKSYR